MPYGEQFREGLQELRLLANPNQAVVFAKSAKGRLESKTTGGFTGV